MGHEGFGFVHTLGRDISTDSLGTPLREGDRIVYAHVFSCNRCHKCVDGALNLCVNRSSAAGGVWPYFTGTYADYLYLPPRHPVFKAPDSIPDEVLAPLNCAMATVTQGLITSAVRQGQSIVIQGAGGLGLTTIAIAKDMGADRVIALDRLESRLELAKEFGATDSINIEEYNTREARIRRVRELTRGRGADVVVEVVGLPELLTEGLEMLDNGGTLLEIGNISPGRTVALDPSNLVYKAKRIVGTIMYPPYIIPRVMDFLERTQSKVPFHKMISHKFKLADVNEAFPQAEWDAKQTLVTRAVLIP